MTRTPRMEQLEALLAEDPDDPFLHYGLAMEYARMGAEAEAAEQLMQTAAKYAYIPAFLQAGQILSRLNRSAEACDLLRRGIDAARKAGDSHAEAEMAALLASLE